MNTVTRPPQHGLRRYGEWVSSFSDVISPFFGFKVSLSKFTHDFVFVPYSTHRNKPTVSWTKGETVLHAHSFRFLTMFVLETRPPAGAFFDCHKNAFEEIHPLRPFDNTRAPFTQRSESVRHTTHQIRQHCLHLSTTSTQRGGD